MDWTDVQFFCMHKFLSKYILFLLPYQLMAMELFLKSADRLLHCALNFKGIHDDSINI